MNPPIRLAVCVSGGGSTLRNLIDRVEDGSLNARVVLVVASRPGIGAIEKARRAEIPVEVVDRGKHGLDSFGRAVFSAIRGHEADLVVLGGFLALLPIPDDYANRVLNIHPSLIPAFSGKGYHGEAVHRAAIESGVKVSGCTVHFADNEYDRGPIILQRVVPVLDDDTPEALADRVGSAERPALAEAIRLFAEGRLRVEGRRVRILGPP